MKNNCLLTKIFLKVFILSAGFYPFHVVLANSLYQEAVENTHVTETVFKKSLKQIKEYKDIEIADPLSVPPFHKRTVSPKNKSPALCTTCHLSLPHQKDLRSRTFMNMHSAYIACETCHFRPKDNALNYRWLAYEGDNTGFPIPPRKSTKAFNEKKDISAHQAQFKKAQALAPQPGARIAPFFNDDLALILNNSAFFHNIKQEWENGSESHKARIKSKLHAPLEKKGLSCSQCHNQKKTIFDWEVLGATSEQRKEINNNTLVRFFERFENENDQIRIDQLLR